MNLIGRKVLTLRTVVGTHVEGLGNVKTLLSTKDTVSKLNMVLIEQGVYVSGKSPAPQSTPFEFILPFQQCISIQLAPESKANEEDSRQ
jgi:hypothetical protein